MARRPRHTPPAIAFDPALAEKAFDDLAAERAALGTQVSAAPRLDLQSVAAVAIGVAADLARPSVHERFENIQKELPIALVDRIGPAGWALWHATVQRGRASATTARALVPVELVERATCLRTTMLKVVQYHLDDDPVLAAEIADIISGTGYSDLASDLQRLAVLYRDHEEVLRTDAHFYCADDHAAAVAAAAEILRALARGEDEAVSHWIDQVNRSFAVLDRAYQRVRLFGLALYHGEHAEERFPTFVSVRAASTRPPWVPLPGASTGCDR